MKDRIHYQYKSESMMFFQFLEVSRCASVNNAQISDPNHHSIDSHHYTL